MSQTVMTPGEANVSVGDFFVESWGYDQTNIDFYRVVGLTPKGVKVQKWSSRVVGENGYSDSVVPGDNPRTGCEVKVEGGWREYRPDATAEVQTKRLTGSPNQPSIKVREWGSWAYKWDGKPQRQTAANYGH